jgi:hypothetical protein
VRHGCEGAYTSRKALLLVFSAVFRTSHTAARIWTKRDGTEHSGSFRGNRLCAHIGVEQDQTFALWCRPLFQY